MEVLKRLKWISPDSQVIMISGHATISTAMTAVKLGALDFIEKPLSLDILLMTVRRALDRQKELQNGMGSEEPVFQEPPRTAPAPSPVQEAVLQSNEISKGKGASFLSQRTIKRSMVVYGTGLHSGMKQVSCFSRFPQQRNPFRQHLVG